MLSDGSVVSRVLVETVGPRVSVEELEVLCRLEVWMVEVDRPRLSYPCWEKSAPSSGQVDSEGCRTLKERGSCCPTVSSVGP